METMPTVVSLPSTGVCNRHQPKAAQATNASTAPVYAAFAPGSRSPWCMASATAEFSSNRTNNTPPTPNTEASCATGNTSDCVYARLPQLPSGVKCASSVSAATPMTGKASSVQPLLYASTMRRAVPMMNSHSNTCSAITMITATTGMTVRKYGRFEVTPMAAASAT